MGFSVRRADRKVIAESWDFQEEKKIYLGEFDNLEEAIEAYTQYEMEFYRKYPKFLSRGISIDKKKKPFILDLGTIDDITLPLFGYETLSYAIRAKRTIIKRLLDFQSKVLLLHSL